MWHPWKRNQDGNKSQWGRSPWPESRKSRTEGQRAGPEAQAGQNRLGSKTVWIRSDQVNANPSPTNPYPQGESQLHQGREMEEVGVKELNLQTPAGSEEREARCGRGQRGNVFVVPGHG